MKKNVLMKSKRMAAFALSLSMILSDGSLIGAAEVNANPETEPAVVAETETTETVDSETTETTETATETSEADVDASDAEAASQETTVPETEAAAPVADVVDPEADEATPAAEATETSEETTEEETENADLEEETEELGAYNGTPSKVIGLEGTNNYKDSEEFDYSFWSADGNTKLSSYSKVKSGVSTFNMPGKKAQYVDPATGLYLVNGRYYARFGEETDTEEANFWGNNQVAAFVPGDSVASCQDKATGLYVLNGVTYGALRNNGTVSYALVGEEGIVAGAAVATPDEVKAVLKGLGRNTDATKVSEEYSDYDYYEVNGQYFKNSTYANVDGKYIPVVYNEISFDKVKTGVKWNSLNTSNRVVNAEGKKIEVGYRFKVNDVIATDENFSDSALQNSVIPATSATEGAMFLLTGTTQTYLKPLIGAGESAKIQVQGVYFVENEIVAADGSKTYTYTVDSVGEWSEPYTFTNTFAGKAPGSATGLKAVPEIGACLNVVQDGTKFKLTWNPVKEAKYTQIVEIASKVPLNITAENFVKFLSLKREGYLLDKDVTMTEEERTALLGTATTSDFIVNCDDTSRASSAEVEVNRDYAYHYFVVKASGVTNDKTNEYVNNTTCSNMVALIVAQTANIPQVTGFKAEKQSDGTYDLVWNPVDANVIIYAYEKQTLPEFFNLSKLNATTVPVTITDEDGDTSTSSVSLRSKLTSGQKALIGKVEYTDEYIDGLTGDDGVSTTSFNLKPGVTYYFTAFTYDDINRNVDQAPIATVDGLNFTRYTNFSPASNVVSVKNDLNKPRVDTKASKDSIKLTLSGAGNPTGYQIYRKNSKNKWKKIATTTGDVYTDADLKENTKYSYRVRSYYYNKDNKKTIYSDYTYKTVSTSQVTNIDVKVTMKSTSQAKVTWTKVSKADKYEIYRSNSSNVDPKTISKKYKNAGDYAQALDDEKFELVKTVKNAKTISFTDKKLKSGETYTYVVMAYFKDGKTTGYISDSDSIEFAVHQPRNVQSENKGTSAKITWDADKFASKFEVKYTLYDKYGEAKSRKATVKTTKKNSYTIKGLESGGYASVSVRAYGKNKTYSLWSDVTNTTSLKAAGSITAKNATEKLASGKTNNVVKISWKKVSGAKYYRVYRSTKTAVYNKDEKKYALPSDAKWISKEGNDDELNDRVCYDEYLGVDGSVIGTSAIDRAQLLDGVTYYYSVVAFGEKDTEIASYVTTTGSKFAYATSKPASVVFNKDLKISSIKNSKKGQVAIKYNKVKDAKQYVIYRADKKNGEFKKIGTSKKTSYTDKKVSKGKTYYYKVVATGTNKAKANMEVTSSVKKIKVKK